MFVPLLILIGIVAIAASTSSSRGRYAPVAWASREQIAPAPSAVPSPIAVLAEYARQGTHPPQTVVWCAIAEAQSLGRNDIAYEIDRIYVQPYQEADRVRAARDANPVSAPRPQRPPHPAVATALPTHAHVAQPQWSPEMDPQYQAHLHAQQAQPAVIQSGGFVGSDDDIQAMLDRDPHAFMQSTLQGIATEPAAMQTQTQTEPDPAPIVGVDADAWDGFCDRLARESPSYQSQRHVGRYRQRKERLAELGIDPSRIASDEEAQRFALEVDLTDQHQHVVASGLAEQYVGRDIVIPGMPEPVAVTLSGVLGVAQAAGLDGAASWLESSRDRKKFPHTTEAFVKTNGMF